jgi:hypothetical protein
MAVVVIRVLAGGLGVGSDDLVRFKKADAQHQR